jgi:hypothetical protein
VGLGTSSASTAASEIPFKATFSGRSARPNQTTVLLDGSGTATHLGRTTNAGHVTVTGYSPACTEGVTAVNVEVLTAANGDTLTLTSNDVTCPTPPGQASKYHGTGHWTVSGGTGRFMYATGSGSFDGIADLGAHTFTITLTGSIDFGGKDS